MSYIIIDICIGLGILIIFISFYTLRINQLIIGCLFLVTKESNNIINNLKLITMKTKLIQIAFGVNIFPNWKFIDFYILGLGVAIVFILLFTLRQIYKESSSFKEGDQL